MTLDTLHQKSSRQVAWVVKEPDDLEIVSLFTRGQFAHFQ